jgi:hypothetical protein
MNNPTIATIIFAALVVWVAIGTFMDSRMVILAGVAGIAIAVVVFAVQAGRNASSRR